MPLFHVCQLCRYSSRAILIPFQAPSLKPCEREDRACYDTFFDCLDTLSSTAGYVIAMGEKFLVLSSALLQMDDKGAIVDPDSSPYILQSVAISMKKLTFSIHSDGLETIRPKVSRTWIRESILLQIMSINSVV